MTYAVLFTADAEADLSDLYDYIAGHDDPARADYVLDAIQGHAAGLAASPHRGNWPKELIALGIREYREVHFKPYRVIYRIIGERVLIYCVADGRREMMGLLQRRLLRDER